MSLGKDDCNMSPCETQCLAAGIQHAHDTLKDAYLEKDERAKMARRAEGERLKLKGEGTFDIMYALRDLIKAEKRKL